MGCQTNQGWRPESRNRRASRLPHPACHRGNARHLTQKTTSNDDVASLRLDCAGFQTRLLLTLVKHTIVNIYLSNVYVSYLLRIVIYLLRDAVSLAYTYAVAY